MSVLRFSLCWFLVWVYYFHPFAPRVDPLLFFLRSLERSEQQPRPPDEDLSGNGSTGWGPAVKFLTQLVSTSPYRWLVARSRALLGELRLFRGADLERSPWRCVGPGGIWRKRFDFLWDFMMITNSPFVFFFFSRLFCLFFLS